MIDPRTKRPTTRDLMDRRHATWLNTLRRAPQRHRNTVIHLQVHSCGKTATVLSERELEVLQLVSFGLTTKEIAERLFLSSHTVTNHRKNMLARTRCGNFSELVRVAFYENLLQ